MGCSLRAPCFFSFFSLLKRHHSFCSCPLFLFGKKKPPRSPSAFVAVVVFTLFSVTGAPPSAVKCPSDCVYIPSCLLLNLPCTRFDTSFLCVPPSFYQFHFRIKKKLSVTHSCIVKWQVFETKGASFSFALSSKVEALWSERVFFFQKRKRKSLLFRTCWKCHLNSLF